MANGVTRAGWGQNLNQAGFPGLNRSSFQPYFSWRLATSSADKPADPSLVKHSITSRSKS